MHSDTMLQIYFGYNGRGPKTPSCGKTMVWESGNTSTSCNFAACRMCDAGRVTWFED